MRCLATACVATMISAMFATGCSSSDGWTRYALFEDPDVRLLVDAVEWHCVDEGGQTACVQTPDGQDGWTCEDVDGHAACRMSVDEFVVQNATGSDGMLGSDVALPGGSGDPSDGTTADPDRNTSDSSSGGQPYVSLGPNDLPENPVDSTSGGTSDSNPVDGTSGGTSGGTSDSNPVDGTSGGTSGGVSGDRLTFDTISADWQCEWNEAADRVVCVSIPKIGDDGDSGATNGDGDSKVGSADTAGQDTAGQDTAGQGTAGQGTAGQGGDDGGGQSGAGSDGMVPNGSVDWQCDVVEFGVLCVTDTAHLDQLLDMDTGFGPQMPGDDEVLPPEQGGCWVTGIGTYGKGVTRDSFGGNAMTMKDGSVRGEWQHVDHFDVSGKQKNGQNLFHGKVEYISCERYDTLNGPEVPKARPNFANWGGHGQFNHVDGYRFDVRAFDHAEGGIHRDRYAITIWDPEGTVVLQADGSGTRDTARCLEDPTIDTPELDWVRDLGCLSGGNFQIHPPNKGHPN